MLNIDDIKNDQELINAIDWEMTPEEAVVLYLEWGNNWSHGKMVKSKRDVAHYFVVDTWEEPPVLCLIRRNSEEAVVLATIPLHASQQRRFLEHVGNNKGIYAPDEKLKTWIQERLSARETLH